MTSTRLRVGAAIGGFGLIALSMFGLGVAASGRPARSGGDTVDRHPAEQQLHR